MKKLVRSILVIIFTLLGIMVNNFVWLYNKIDYPVYLGIHILGTLLIIIAMIVIFNWKKREQKALKERKDALEKALLEVNLAKEEIIASEEAVARQLDDIQSQKEALTISQERLHLSLDGAEVGLWDLDYKTNNIHLSEKSMEIVGISRDDTVIKTCLFLDRIEKLDRRRFLLKLDKHLTGKTNSFEVECRIINDAGQYNWFSIRGKALLNQEGEPSRVAGSINNINHQKLTEEKIVNLAYYDPMTGLPNRSYFITNYSNSTQNIANNKICAIIVLDLDNFKAINDSLGYKFGDKVLLKTVRIIKKFAPPDAIISRFGGDEFIMLIKSAKDKKQIVSLVDTLIKVFQKTYEVAGVELTFTVSMGIALAPEDASELKTLVKYAETAMHEAKSNGKNCYEFYSSALNKRVVARLELENQLRKAVEKKNFVLYYQAKYDLEEKTINGFEALIRWKQEDRLIMPNVFIPLAEELGLIIPIGEWVVEEVCHEINRLKKMGLDHITISLNLSAKQFKDINLIYRFIKTLETYNVEPNAIELEITESTAVYDSKYAFQMLNAFRSFGTKIALDDFGTGYSSFNYLKLLPLDYIKIDKSFMDDILMDKKGEDVIRAIITLSHAYGYKTVAEGVETKEQLDFLLKENCDVIQGYYISKPVPSKSIKSVLEKTAF